MTMTSPPPAPRRVQAKEENEGQPEGGAAALLAARANQVVTRSTGAPDPLHCASLGGFLAAECFAAAEPANQ